MLEKNSMLMEDIIDDNSFPQFEETKDDEAEQEALKFAITNELLQEKNDQIEIL